MWPFTALYPERTAADIDGKTYDYIIVGGGTSGCVLASRLSEDEDVSVLLLEKGKVMDTLLSRIPIASEDFRRPDSQAVVRHPEPIPAANDRRVTIWCAEALGGTSRINGKLVTRGIPAGYNEWGDMGCSDWGWDEVEPYFRKSENAHSHPNATHRGHNGPWQNIQHAPPFSIHAYLPKAAESLGLSTERDLNNPNAPPRGYYITDYAIDTRGVRASTDRAFLPKALAIKRQASLTVCTGVIATRLELDAQAGLVTGVHLRSRGANLGLECFVRASREVIICSGAVCTPQLLMLSGIGPEDHLSAHDIPVKRRLAGVGNNLKDHIAIPISIIVPTHESFHRFDESLLLALWHAILWLLFGAGLLGSCCHPASIFYRSSDVDTAEMKIKRPKKDDESFNDPYNPQNIPDIEVMLFSFHGILEPTPRSTGLFSFHTTLVQPESKGRIELASTEPEADPKIIYPMFTDASDFVAARTAVRFSLHLHERLVASGYPHEAKLYTAPGADKGRGWRDLEDEEIDDYVRAKAQPALHVACTCRMASEPDGGVVDSRLRVHGFKNLRISDASVFPKIPSNHTMAPVVMVAERCADFVKVTWKEDVQDTK